MQNDSIFYPWGSITQSHNWQDSINTFETVAESDRRVTESREMKIDLDAMLFWFSIYAVIIMILLLIPNGKTTHRKD
jgi:hypothetical protein